MYYLVLIINLWILFCYGEHTGPVVDTPLGKVKGYHKFSSEGRKFSAFEGIPYAIPPIGERRFQEPEPIKPWYGTWHATYLHSCVQMEPNDPTDVSAGINISGDEDCLYVNVYVPRTKPNSSEKLDVIVHIHGGAFMFGNGHLYAYPEILMDQEVIFVTFNYRLGVFGFLSTEDDVVPGNNGLKDQALVLQWIQNNIDSFGGNSSSVTLTGASAGGASVHLHYFSNISRGLFHNGLSNSGSAIAPWVIQKSALNRAISLGKALNCPTYNRGPTNSSLQLVECFRQRTYHQILKQSVQVYGYKFEPVCLFTPVVEKGSRPFLEQHPLRSLKEQGMVQDLPWVTSTVIQEGRLFTSTVFKDNIEAINKEWKKYFPHLLYYSHRPDSDLLREKIGKYYLGGNSIVTRENYEQFIKMIGDRLFVDSSIEAAKLQAAVNKEPVYYYSFGYMGDSSTYVKHSDDNQYFYGLSGKKLTDNELKMKRVMVKMLVSYASTGKPSIEDIQWDPTHSDNLKYLNISSFDHIKMEVAEEGADEKFWKSLEQPEKGNDRE